MVGVTQDVLDQALAEPDVDLSVSQIPEFEDPADIQSDLVSSMVRDVPKPGEVCVCSLYLLLLSIIYQYSTCIGVSICVYV